MTALEATFYDEAMTSEGALAMLPVRESPWLPVYSEAQAWIPANHAVVDLGCGTGRFIHILRWRNHYGPIEGLDFSAASIEEAEAYLLSQGFADVDLGREDLREWEPRADRAGNTTYVCLEVLEHLADDLDLVRRIPPGHQLVLSVPNYESEGHVRIFRGAGDVFARYHRLLTFRRWSLIDLGEGKAIHVLDTTRRTDSW